MCPLLPPPTWGLHTGAQRSRSWLGWRWNWGWDRRGWRGSGQRGADELGSWFRVTRNVASLAAPGAGVAGIVSLTTAKCNWPQVCEDSLGPLLACNGYIEYMTTVSLVLLVRGHLWGSTARVSCRGVFAKGSCCDGNKCPVEGALKNPSLKSQLLYTHHIPVLP
eukprot:990299-Pelagomonas_calceolata.AAC.3